jgi:hypothetical protein
MIRVTFNIRILYAYALLSVMAMQWLAGSMYLSVTYLVESTPVMNATETAIADDVLDQYGIQVHVNVVDDLELQFIQGLGYAAPFVHSVEIDGNINAYTLGSGESEYKTIEVAIDNRSGKQHDQKQQVCLDKLFAQFCLGQPDSDVENQIALTENNFSVISLYDIFSFSHPAPPPKAT